MNEPMNDGARIPDDDPARTLHVADPEAAGTDHLAVVGNTYTVLVSGRDSNGAYCLIDMYIREGGGPPPHRHDFEETFTLLEGTLEFTFRDETRTVSAPATVHVPANAPHRFANPGPGPVRALCICSPAGQEELFAALGDPVDGRTAAPPALSEAELRERMELGARLAPEYRTEILT